MSASSHWKRKWLELQLALAARAAWCAVKGRGTMETKYSKIMGFWKAFVVLGVAMGWPAFKGLASLQTPDTWGAFCADWSGTLFPIVATVWLAFWNWAKVQGYVGSVGVWLARLDPGAGGKGIVLLVACAGLIAAPGCASFQGMTTGEQTAIVSTVGASVVAGGTAILKAYDDHQKAKSELEAAEARAALDRAVTQTQVATGIAKDVAEIIRTFPPKAATTGTAK
jgi:hypothetical protein